MAESTPDPVFEFERVLKAFLARVFAFRSPDASRQEGEAKKRAMAVAYSGGLDSTVLLHLAHAYAVRNGMDLFAFHIHHGISVKADEWLLHCEKTCRRLGIDFDARRVLLNRESGEGTEAAARRARYAALAALCRERGIELLLTAHHEDDQAETVIMQLMRGAGVAGLSGMDVLGTVPGAVDEEAPQLLRPLLGVSRKALENWAKEQRLSYVEDDSNTDLQYARNAVRLKVMPVLGTFFPGFERRMARSAQHMQSAQRLLVELAELDWETCRDGDALDVVRMAELGKDRFDNLFRFWLDRQGVRMPSTAWLREARLQLLGAREDAQIRLELEGAVVRRYRRRLIFQESQKANEAGPGLEADFLPLIWQGESRMPVLAFGGEWLFEAASEGVDAGWLRGRSLHVRPYYGKAMLKVEANRPARSLKAHYQERQVPAWERQRLPLLYADGELLFAAGIGMAVDYVGKGGDRVWIGWAPLA